jgi:hypothetical protein
MTEEYGDMFASEMFRHIYVKKKLNYFWLFNDIFFQLSGLEHSSVGNDENHENISQDRQYSGRDSNP